MRDTSEGEETQAQGGIHTWFATFFKLDKIIDFEAIILISVPSQQFSMGISFFDMSSIYEFERK